MWLSNKIESKKYVKTNTKYNKLKRLTRKIRILVKS